MILDLFRYFSQFPRKEGVLSIFSNGGSPYNSYSDLKGYVSSLPDNSYIPGISSFVFGQSFDSVKARIDNLTGTYLFIDYGEFTSGRDNRNNIQDHQKVAATIAVKVADSSDLVEEAIASETTLILINELRANLIYDSERGCVPWLNRGAISEVDIVPFVAKELKSIGWTLMFSTDASDLFSIKKLMKSFIRLLNPIKFV
ncbi:MAG: hypothetical protein RSO15_09710 [Bacteroides sp.]|uniref:hypothetical protein n=1 Tax=Bacteroides sp. TaxID=29523 RepID=UPI002FC9FB6F